VHTLPEKAQQILQTQKDVDEQLRKIFFNHFEIDSEQYKDNVGYKGWATMASEVGVALANVIMSAQDPNNGRGYRAITDLVYTLNANDFWMKNAPVLVPILTVVLNAHKDGISYRMEKENLSEYAMYDKLTAATELVALEIFSMLLYLVGGPLLMSLRSGPLKFDLAPYFLR
jgi:hypothetical protein